MTTKPHKRAPAHERAPAPAPKPAPAPAEKRLVPFYRFRPGRVPAPADRTI